MKGYNILYFKQNIQKIKKLTMLKLKKKYVQIFMKFETWYFSMNLKRRKTFDPEDLCLIFFINVRSLNFFTFFIAIHQQILLI